jgi:hypothetical protein
MRVAGLSGREGIDNPMSTSRDIHILRGFIEAGGVVKYA